MIIQDIAKDHTYHAGESQAPKADNRWLVLATFVVIRKLTQFQIYDYSIRPSTQRELLRRHKLFVGVESSD